MNNDAMSAPPPSPLLLDAHAAAKLCGVSRATWWGWLAAGLCPTPLRIGPRVVRWRRDELTAWVAGGCPARDRWRAVTGGRP